MILLVVVGAVEVVVVVGGLTVEREKCQVLQLRPGKKDKLDLILLEVVVAVEVVGAVEVVAVVGGLTVESESSVVSCCELMLVVAVLTMLLFASFIYQCFIFSI